MNGDGKDNPMNPLQCRAWSTVEKLKVIKMKQVKLKAQQGDVVLRKLETLPVGEVKSMARRLCVLADGEHTGHQHVVECDDAELIEIGGRMILKLKRAATVVHPEHKPITLQPGIWEVGRIVEYDYLTKMTVAVRD